MALYPAAKKRLIAPGANDPRIKPRIGILHVDASNASSLFNWFNGPSGGVESHFHIPKVAQLEQYRDTDWEADANFKASPFAISIETQGFGTGTWNDKQLKEIKDLMFWCRDTHQIPLKVCKDWDGEGWGYHTLFPEWSNVTGKTCPGPERKQQFFDILVPWMKEQGDDMFKPEDQQRLEDVEAKLDGLIAEFKRFKVNATKRDRKIIDLVKSMLPK